MTLLHYFIGRRISKFWTDIMWNNVISFSSLSIVISCLNNMVVFCRFIEVWYKMHCHILSCILSCVDPCLPFAIQKAYTKPCTGLQNNIFLLVQAILRIVCSEYVLRSLSLELSSMLQIHLLITQVWKNQRNEVKGVVFSLVSVDCGCITCPFVTP